MDFVISFFFWVKFNMFKFVRVSCVTLIMIFPLCLFRMQTDLSLKVASQPLLHNVPMDSRDLLIPEKICAFRA